MEIYTIGFTQKSARDFFGALSAAGIRRLIDVRLNNSSQLAGFTKKDDLIFFLERICGAEYLHEPQLAPTAEILNGIKKKEISWEEYERQFNALLKQRRIAKTLDPRLFSVPAVLLCSEPTPEHCHRRLVAEYLQRNWSDVSITHL